MAELTELDSKIGEVLGLAMAAQDSAKQVEKLLDGDSAELAERLQRMREEAAQTQERTETIADAREGKKTAIHEQARETKREATEMMKAYLGDDADALDGFEWLIMAEAGELGHWEIVRTMSDAAGENEVKELADFVLPIQERHFQTVRESSLELAKREV
jgi:hypothetical protein